MSNNLATSSPSLSNIPLEIEAQAAAHTLAASSSQDRSDSSGHNVASDACPTRTSSSIPTLASGSNPVSPNALNLLEGATETEEDVVKNPWAKVTAEIWKYYECKVIDGKKTAICTFCKDKLLGDPRKGTTHLKNHYERCEKRKYVDIRQQILQGKFSKEKEKFELTSYKFNQEASRRDCYA